MSNKLLGSHGEWLAEEYLKSKGFIIIEKNFKNKIGEIDIIAKDGSTLCFVEVKTRKSLNYGQPFESVHYSKIRKLSLLALSYLKFRFQRIDIAARFDVLSIYCLPSGTPQIHHIKNAFDVIY